MRTIGSTLGGLMLVLLAVAVQTPEPLTSVESGGEHSCGLTADGTVLCWGSGSEGALGDRQFNHPGIDSVPAPVPGTPPFTKIAASLQRTCGITASGEVHCWGLTFGATPRRIAVPVPIVDLDVAVNQFCGHSAEQVAYCWTGFAVEKTPGQR